MPSPRSFRCWDTKNKRFLEEVPPREYMLDTDEWHHCEDEDLMSYPDSPLITFAGRLVYDQDTGLLDIKGEQPIYENDIVSFTIKGITHGPEREEVAAVQVWYSQEDACWAFGQWVFNLGPASGGEKHQWWYTMQDRIDRSTLRVIGNVWMNPEMLTHEVVK